jgi:hypothetical protein
VAESPCVQVTSDRPAAQQTWLRLHSAFKFGLPLVIVQVRLTTSRGNRPGRMARNLNAMPPGPGPATGMTALEPSSWPSLAAMTRIVITASDSPPAGRRRSSSSLSHGYRPGSAASELPSAGPGPVTVTAGAGAAAKFHRSLAPGGRHHSSY